jgi:hypothetical protein
MIHRFAAWSLFAAIVAAGGCAGNQSSSAASGGKRDGGGDLAQLQGTWQQQPEEGRAASPQQRVVKQVSGNTETVTTYGPNGQVLHAQTAKIRLGRSGSVPVYTFYDRRITAGPEQGRGDNAARSFVYRLRGDEFDEVWGLLPGQEQRELVIHRWRRAAP